MLLNKDIKRIYSDKDQEINSLQDSLRQKDKKNADLMDALRKEKEAIEISSFKKLQNEKEEIFKNREKTRLSENNILNNSIRYKEVNAELVECNKNIKAAETNYIRLIEAGRRRYAGDAHETNIKLEGTDQAKDDMDNLISLRKNLTRELLEAKTEALRAYSQKQQKLDAKLNININKKDSEYENSTKAITESIEKQMNEIKTTNQQFQVNIQSIEEKCSQRVGEIQVKISNLLEKSQEKLLNIRSEHDKSLTSIMQDEENLYKELDAEISSLNKQRTDLMLWEVEAQKKLATVFESLGKEQFKQCSPDQLRQASHLLSVTYTAINDMKSALKIKKDNTNNQIEYCKKSIEEKREIDNLSSGLNWYQRHMYDILSKQSIWLQTNKQTLALNSIQSLEFKLKTDCTNAINDTSEENIKALQENINTYKRKFQSQDSLINEIMPKSNLKMLEYSNL